MVTRENYIRVFQEASVGMFATDPEKTEFGTYIAHIVKASGEDPRKLGEIDHRVIEMIDKQVEAINERAVSALKQVVNTIVYVYGDETMKAVTKGNFERIASEAVIANKFNTLIGSVGTVIDDAKKAKDSGQELSDELCAALEKKLEDAVNMLVGDEDIGSDIDNLIKDTEK